MTYKELTVILDIVVAERDSDGGSEAMALQEGTSQESYVVAVTNAPDDYDHPHVVPLGAFEEWRTILVPTDSRQWQEGRCRSGLFQFSTDPSHKYFGNGTGNLPRLAQWVSDRLRERVSS
jgi:hypothetical protein